MISMAKKYVADLAVFRAQDARKRELSSKQARFIRHWRRFEPPCGGCARNTPAGVVPRTPFTRKGYAASVNGTAANGCPTSFAENLPLYRQSRIPGVPCIPGMFRFSAPSVHRGWFFRRIGGAGSESTGRSRPKISSTIPSTTHVIPFQPAKSCPGAKLSDICLQPLAGSA